VHFLLRCDKIMNILHIGSEAQGLGQSERAPALPSKRIVVIP
jgi:hypothetical protein